MIVKLFTQAGVEIAEGEAPAAAEVLVWRDSFFVHAPGLGDDVTWMGYVATTAAAFIPKESGRDG